jgi:O-succinylbenzoic acid--CoA ligase
VLIGTDALLASAHATHAALGGPGTWLLALPPDRIGGALVLVRSHVAGTRAVPMPRGPFSAEAFAIAAAELPRNGPRYTSLVPTQLYRLLSDPVGLRALARLDAVLVGGGPVHGQSLPSTVITTYGSTETTGGCVYDGTPIGDTRIDVRDGLVRVAGSTLASGYADRDDSRFVTEAGTRWFVTNDVGDIDSHGRLHIHGRADDVIITGGVKVAPGVVEAALGAQGWVLESVVVGLPHAEWGEAVVALVAPLPGHEMPELDHLREELSGTLSREQIPRAVHAVAALPRLSSGKIDRASARSLAARLESERG